MMISKGQTRSHLSFDRRSWSFCFAVARIFVGHVTRPPPREGTRRNTRSQTCPSEPPTSSPRQKKFRSAASPPPARTPPAPFLLPPRQGGAGSPLRIPHSLRGGRGRDAKVMRNLSAVPFLGRGLALSGQLFAAPPLYAAASPLRGPDRKFPSYDLLSSLRLPPAIYAGVFCIIL